MDAAILKYDMLSPFQKKEVSDFIDFLLMRSKNTGNNFSPKKRHFPDSVWSEDDLKVLKKIENI